MIQTCMLLFLAVSGTFLTGCKPKVTIGDKTWKVRLALTGHERYKGLSNQPELPEDEGMLFIFRRPKKLSFVMRECDHPLDVAFIDAEHRVVKIHEMKVEDSRRGDVKYGSGVPAQYALEVKGGTLKKAGVSVGDKVEFSYAVPDPAKADP